jgi:pimeloyl-ACP methyl ester carboxylesterase
MSTRILTLGTGRKVACSEIGKGPPLLYLHDFADIHAIGMEWFEFHKRLSESFRVIAPAHPGCGESDEDERANTIEDVVFGLLEVLDALGFESMPVVGTGVGGWIAAELAVRHRRMVERLALISPAGLFVPGELIGDIFMMSHPRDGYDHSDLRRLLFARHDSPEALELFPDGRASIEQEVLWYRMFRFVGRVGFNPPYLHHRLLGGRLPRYDRPALILAGTDDALIPAAHARHYAEQLREAKLITFRGAGHSLHLERPTEAANAVLDWLNQRAAASAA